MKFIFEVRMKSGFTVEEYADGWVKASTIMQQTPGARGTYLHRKIGEPDVVLAIAHWESKAARDKKDDNASELVRQILAKHARNCDIKIIGEFDEPEWQALPPDKQQTASEIANQFSKQASISGQEAAKQNKQKHPA